VEEIGSGTQDAEERTKIALAAQSVQVVSLLLRAPLCISQVIHQGTAARTTSILLGFMNAEIVSAWIEGNGGTATPELIRQRQFHYHCGIAMIAMEDYFSQHEDGLLSDEQFSRGCETFRGALREPGLRAYWLKHRETMTKEAPRYCAFIDSLCAGEPMASGDLDFRQNGKS
jgi:hypothetical protein